MITVSGLYVYPIKSLGGISLSSVNITDRGFEHDRRWMLVDDNSRFLTQRERPVMALLQVQIISEGLKVFHKNQPGDFIIVPFINAAEKLMVDIWGTVCEARPAGKEIDKWFSEKLDTSCRLVYMPDATKLKVDERYAFNKELTSFSDGFPVLMISEASLSDLNSKATEQLPVNRFRPNLVITGSAAFEEDTMKEFMINDIVFYGAKPSARCAVTTIDQSTAVKGKEPLKTLAAYRGMNNKIYFGENVLAASTGSIAVGDSITILQRKESLFG